MERRVLDQIVDRNIDDISFDDSLQNPMTKISQSDEEAENSSLSIMDLDDAAAFRLDIPDPAMLSEKPKQLFYTEDTEDDALNPEKNIGIARRPKKKVRFNRMNQKDLASQEGILYPWELKQVIRQEFRNKLPNNYEIKQWRKPSSIMVNSVIQLLDTNVQNSIEQVFDRYRSELLNVTHQDDQEVGKIYRQKQSIMNDIVSKIKVRLRKSRFPSRISERDLDIEYIVSKRKFIQRRYAEELDNAERVENELFKEQQLLEDARQSCKEVKQSNRTKLTDSLIKKNLHPSLSEAIENAYGLIKDPKKDISMAGFGYQRESNEFNLKMTPAQQPSDNLSAKIVDYLPALQRLDMATSNIQETLNKFTRDEKQKVKGKFTDLQ